MNTVTRRKTKALLSLVFMIISLSFIPQTAIGQAKDVPIVQFDRRANGGPVVGGLQLLANLDRPIYAAGEPIILRIAIYNTLPDLFVMSEDGIGQDLFQVEVTDANGKHVPLTQWGQSLPAPHSGVPESTSARQLFENNVAYYQILLNREFDLTKRGNYKISVVRPYAYGNRNGGRSLTVRLETKPVTFMIVEPGADLVNPQAQMIATSSGFYAGPIVKIN